MKNFIRRPIVLIILCGVIFFCSYAVGFRDGYIEGAEVSGWCWWNNLTMVRNMEECFFEFYKHRKLPSANMKHGWIFYKTRSEPSAEKELLTFPMNDIEIIYSLQSKDTITPHLS